MWDKDDWLIDYWTDQDDVKHYGEELPDNIHDVQDINLKMDDNEYRFFADIPWDIYAEDFDAFIDEINERYSED